MSPILTTSLAGISAEVKKFLESVELDNLETDAVTGEYAEETGNTRSVSSAATSTLNQIVAENSTAKRVGTEAQGAAAPAPGGLGSINFEDLIDRILALFTQFQKMNSEHAQDSLELTLAAFADAVQAALVEYNAKMTQATTEMVTNIFSAVGYGLLLLPKGASKGKAIEVSDEAKKPKDPTVDNLHKQLIMNMIGNGAKAIEQSVKIGTTAEQELEADILRSVVEKMRQLNKSNEDWISNSKEFVKQMLEAVKEIVRHALEVMRMKAA